MLPRRLLVAVGWVILAVINLGLYEYAGGGLSALMAALAAGVAVAMLVGILRDSL